MLLEFWAAFAGVEVQSGFQLLPLVSHLHKLHVCDPEAPDRVQGWGPLRKGLHQSEESLGGHGAHTGSWAVSVGGRKKGS